MTSQKTSETTFFLVVIAHHEISTDNDVKDARHEELNQLCAVDHTTSPLGSQTVPGDGDVAVPHADLALANEASSRCHGRAALLVVSRSRTYLRAYRGKT